jgi:hypothetical protein
VKPSAATGLPTALLPLRWSTLLVASPATGRWLDHQQVSGLDVLGP